MGKRRFLGELVDDCVWPPKACGGVIFSDRHGTMGDTEGFGKAGSGGLLKSDVDESRRR